MKIGNLISPQSCEISVYYVCGSSKISLYMSMLSCNELIYYYVYVHKHR
jgi:hypothetical protein